jgi:hypothetical protein
MAGFEDSFYGQFLRLNPFPEGSADHRDFVRAAGILAEHHSRVAAGIQERLQEASTGEDYFQLRLFAVARMFDVYAGVIVLATSAVNLRQCLEAIENLADWYFAKGTNHTSSLDARRLRQELQITLTHRKFHWAAECHRAARESERTSAMPTPSSSDQSTDTSPDSSSFSVGAKRREFVEPILQKRGWSRTKWAQIANVDRSVVFGYLEGRSSPQAESRASLAGALGIEADDLPL